MHTETYSRSLPLLAAALSGQRGIRVEIGGDKACTDGATIRLPSLPLDMDDALLGVARGFLDHESAHILFSAFDALKMRQNDAAAHLRIKPVPGTGSSKVIFAFGFGRNIGKK
jgi:hypothetical protein